MPNFFTEDVLNSMIIWLPALLVWTAFWKGYALWHAARNYQKPWFITLLFLNTLGIVEILYLVAFQKNNNPKPKLTKTKRQSK